MENRAPHWWQSSRGAGLVAGGGADSGAGAGSAGGWGVLSDWNPLQRSDVQMQAVMVSDSTSSGRQEGRATTGRSRLPSNTERGKHSRISAEHNSSTEIHSLPVTALLLHSMYLDR